MNRSTLTIDSFPWEGQYEVDGYWVESHEDWGNGHVVFERQHDSITIAKLSANSYRIGSADDDEPSVFTTAAARPVFR